MKILNQLSNTKFENYVLPGVTKPVKTEKLVQDLLFFILVIAFPTSFFAFLPQSLFYDIRLIYWLLGMFYGLFYFKYLKKINNIPGGSLLIILVLFVIFRFVYSIVFNNIETTEVITIFRTNFHYPITALGFLLYAASMSNNRINRFLYWLYKTSLVLSILYIVSVLTGINFYAVVTKEESIEFLTLGQNLAAMPAFINFLLVIGLILAFMSNKKQYHFWWIVPLVIAILSIIRSLIISYLIILLLFFIIVFLYFKEIKLTRIFTFSILLALLTLSTSILFSAHIQKFAEKFGFNQEQQVSVSNYLEEGTFAFRIRLIEEAYEQTKRQGNLLMGNGYIRESEKGTYSFVLGTDTFIAPVIYTEGFIGMFLRILPILFFFILGINNMKKSGSMFRIIWLIIVIMIFPSFINPVQTDIFVRYTNTMFIFYLFMLYIYNQQKANKQNSYINTQHNG